MVWWGELELAIFERRSRTRVLRHAPTPAFISSAMSRNQLVGRMQRLMQPLSLCRGILEIRRPLSCDVVFTTLGQAAYRETW
jgi:hypothetical protein